MEHIDADQLLFNLDAMLSPGVEEADGDLARQNLDQGPTPGQKEATGDAPVAREHHHEGDAARGKVRQPADGRTEPPATVLLSSLITAIPPQERRLVIDGYEDAIRRGIIRAVPVEGKPIPISMSGSGGKRVRRTLREEWVRDTPELKEWITAQRTESRYAAIAATGRVVSTVERLESGEDDFERLAEIRRQLLRRKTGRGEE